MMKSKNYGNRTCVVLVAGALVFVLAGCINVKAPESVKIDGKSYYGEKDKKEHKDGGKHERKREPREKKMDGDEAKRIARGLAKDTGIKVRDYKIKDKKIDGNYWVLFEHKRPSRRRRWKNYFPVRVSRTGRGLLYEGESVKIHRDDLEEDELEKDDAYRIARQIAYNHGVNPREYEIHDKKFDGNFWVLFEKKQPRRGGGRKSHFAVRVSKSGRARVYK